ncbi:11644_t:CDS:2, partial [Diversispora eburnea]
YGSQIPDRIPQVSTVSEQPSNTVSALITSEEIDRKIQTAVASLENQKSESNKIRSDPNLYLNNMDSDPSFFQNLMNIMKDISNYLANHEITASGKRKKNNPSSSDDMDAITKGMAELSLNLAKTSKVIKNLNSENDSSDSDSETGFNSEDDSAEFDHIKRKKNSGKSSPPKPKQPKVKKEGTKFRVSSSKSCKESQSKQTILEQIIRKIVRSELNEIIPLHLLQSFEPKFSSIRPAHIE